MGAAVVKVYRGTEVWKNFEIPATVGSQRGYTAFSLDASKDEDNIKAGDWVYGPQLVTGANAVKNTASWGVTFDMPIWSKVPNGAVLVGIETRGATDQQHQNLHQIAGAKSTKIENM